MDITIPQSNFDNAAPVATSDRIKTIDMIRGVALFGILLMNIPGFGIHWSIFNTIQRGPHNIADFHTLQVISVFFEGTMRGLFSMLFGAGMILFTMNKKEILGGVTIGELYYRRLLVLILFGIINAYVFLWFGDILYFYGFAGMVLYPFRKTATKWLFVLGIVCIGIGMLKGQLNHNETREKRAAYVEAVKQEKTGKTLTAEQQQKKTEWLQIENWKPDTESRDRDVREIRSGYGSVFAFFLPWNSGGETWYLYNGIWDSLCMMFIGMGLLVIGFFSNKLSTSSYLMGLVIGYGIGIPVGIIIFSGEINQSLHIGSYIDNYSVPHSILYDVKRVFLSLGHASLIILIFRSRIIPWLMRALANVGQMAFSNYLMQSIICTLFFYGYGLGYYNHLKYHQLYYVVVSVWVFQLIFSSIWLRYYRFGPFEWVWRSLTYWKKQPFRKKLITD